jgi:hypothetical protein
VNELQGELASPFNSFTPRNSSRLRSFLNQHQQRRVHTKEANDSYSARATTGSNQSGSSRRS